MHKIPTLEWFRINGKRVNNLSSANCITENLTVNTVILKHTNNDSKNHIIGGPELNTCNEPKLSLKANIEVIILHIGRAIF